MLISLMFVACKKTEVVEPIKKTTIVPVKKSTHPIQGFWYLWKVDTYIGGTYSKSDLYTDYTCQFDSLKLLKTEGINSYTYPVTYNSGEVTVQYPTTSTIYYLHVNINYTTHDTSNELHCYIGGLKDKIWYLKR